MTATARFFLARAIPGRPRPPGERRPGPAPGLPRQRVTQEQLIAALNLRIARRMDGEGIWVDAGRTLRRPQPDEDGCNWSPCALHVHLSHGPGVRTLSPVRQVVEWGRMNLELAER